MTNKIKICGLMSVEDAMVVNEVKADYAGLVFANTRRKVSYEVAKSIRDTLDISIPTVGVFVNHDCEEILKLVENGIITCIQLHGDEDAKVAQYLREKAQVPIIKAFRIRSQEDVLKAKNYPADYYLFDTYAPDCYGGTGISFDWSMLGKTDKPYFLAGGLDEHNIQLAKKMNAFALDISSGVETSGRKDPDKIRKIVDLVHGDTY